MFVTLNVIEHAYYSKSVQSENNELEQNSFSCIFDIVKSTAPWDGTQPKEISKPSLSNEPGNTRENED